MWKAGSVFLMLLAFVSVQAEESRDVKVVRTLQGLVRGHSVTRTCLSSKAYLMRLRQLGKIVSNLYRRPSSLYRLKHVSVISTKEYAPLPPPTWVDTFDAVDKDIICPQSTNHKMALPGHKKMEEDCLVASVYVPDTTTTSLPVIVYVHGGAFQMGYGDAFTPKQFVQDRNLIAVTFNYRLGVHGFLCLGTEHAPGNAGMKDQIALLRWVKKNIASFGGNPDDVTISGYSAGSAAVDLLLLSPSATGLFKRAIPESGANIAPWANEVDPIQKAKKYASILNFTDTDDIFALETFYITTPIERLTSYFKMDEKDSTFGFSPCVERATEEEIFLSDSPFNILRSGDFNKVPLLYGFASMEGLIRIMFFETSKDEMNTKFSDFLPADLTFEDDEQKEEVARNVKKFYFGDQQVGEDTIVAYIDYFSDVMFAYPALRSLKLQEKAGNNKIYLYEYSFIEKGGNPSGYKNVTVNGAAHCAQTFCILDMPQFFSPPGGISEEFKNIKEIVNQMWYNFITTDQPVPEGSSLPTWPAMGADWAPHMSLGNQVELRGSLLPERVRFWDAIYERHYRNPVPPPQPPKRHVEL